MKLYEENPTRCIDPIIKYCQGCRYGHIQYPEWVETAEDLEWSGFEAFCMYGFDKGRPEDEPTEEEWKEFEEWNKSMGYNLKQTTAESLLNEILEEYV